MESAAPMHWALGAPSKAVLWTVSQGSAGTDSDQRVVPDSGGARTPRSSPGRGAPASASTGDDLGPQTVPRAPPSPVPPVPSPGLATLPASARGGHTSAPRRFCKHYMQRLQTTANHVLFYVVDEHDEATLAIVGTDARLSGHFIYCSLPGFLDGPPLRCSNRTKVMEWLAALGAGEAGDASAMTVPTISAEQLDLLLSSDPMFSKPKLDTQYTNWREESGKLPDGRHFKNFYLVAPESGMERLVITAEDSHRRDRRYAYRATPDMGGFTFENGTAACSWLDFVVGRSPGGGGLAGSLKRGRCTMAVDATVGSPAPKTARRSSLGCSPPPSPCAAGAASYHSGELFSARSASLAVGGGDAQMMTPRAAAGTAAAALQQLAAGAMSDDPDAGVVPTAPSPAVRLAKGPAPEVVAAFQGAQQLLSWVCGSPDPACLARVELWCAKLREAGAMAGPAGAVQGVGSTAAEAAAQEALRVLRLIQAEPVSLGLLETTQVAAALSNMSAHSDARIAGEARRIMAAWQDTAAAALRRVRAAMAPAPTA